MRFNAILQTYLSRGELKMDTAFYKKQQIIKENIGIYDDVEIGDNDFWYSSNELEFLLSRDLIGLNVEYPLRTRSKIVKEKICESLGFLVPKSFKKTQPRFPSQNFDVYTQQSNNLQIWNEEVEPARRYVLIQISDKHIIESVKVVNGSTISDLDTTGKLTQKYQASFPKKHDGGAKLLNATDSFEIPSVKNDFIKTFSGYSPSDFPQEKTLLPISVLHQRLQSLIGSRILYLGPLQERNRGGELHKLVCKSLGYEIFKDDGQFPDIKHQLLEIKLQTSPTVDLGLILPGSDLSLDMPKFNGSNLKMKDVRYAIFYGFLIPVMHDTEPLEHLIEITDIYLVNGENFFTHFKKFEGNEINAKLQIPLPNDFWDKN